MTLNVGCFLIMQKENKPNAQSIKKKKNNVLYIKKWLQMNLLKIQI